MRALVKQSKGPNGTRLCEMPVPKAMPGEAVIRVQSAAICASDIHIHHDDFSCTLPVVLGHEFTGIVDRIGEGVTTAAVGDAVVSENNPEACGACPACSGGYPNICSEKRAIGFKRDGCFAEYVSLPAQLLHKVPLGTTPAAAALSEPLAVAVHAVEDRCGIRQGETVVVFGPGAIGILCAQVARAEGAGRVVVVGTDADADLRLPCAAELGFETCNVERDDLYQQVVTPTNRFGADVAVEASGAPRATDMAIQIVRRGGRLAILGITGRPSIPVAWDDLVCKAATVSFAFSSRPCNWEKAMRYLAEGRVVTEPLVTHRFALEDWRDAFGAMASGTCIRALFQMQEVRA